MNLVNIYNKDRFLYLFIRNNDGSLTVQEDKTFYPYFYEPHAEGKYNSFDGKKLKKIFCTSPSDVPKLRTLVSYEADLLYYKRYIIDRVETIEKSPIKWFMMDIEVKAPELPAPNNPIYPVSCITVYNSFTKEYKTWRVTEPLKVTTILEQEKKLLADFVSYIKNEQPDLLIGWNMVKFDYEYLYMRIKRRFNMDFAKAISPIGESRRATRELSDEGVFFPAGISIIDLCSWFKKISKSEFTYELDNIAQVHLKEKPWAKTNFDEISDLVRDKNINDVVRMVKLNEQKHIIEYFDAIRRLSKVCWEDFEWNSRIIEMLLFQEAQALQIILPTHNTEELEKEEYEGATRDVGDTGFFEGVAKVDLGSAYPTEIIEFCLDPSNIQLEAGENNVLVDGTYFKQNSDAIFPRVCKKLLTLKAEIKDKKKKAEGTDQSEEMAILYDAIKSVVNSAYGVMGNRFFRLYDKRVASATTFLVRDVLTYVKNQFYETTKRQVLYWDTDSLFIEGKDNPVAQLNDLIDEWVRQYGKPQSILRFEWEGYFDKLILLKKCRYVGDLRKPSGKVEREIKGVEIKRKDSSKYMVKFQTDLINRIFEREPYERVKDWVLTQKGVIKTCSITDIAFPAKVSTKEYKSKPIFIRALEYTKTFVPEMNKRPGDTFQYLYIVPAKEIVDSLYFGRKKITDAEYKVLSAPDQAKVKTRQREVTSKNNVIAFDADHLGHVKNIDWDMMIGRNIVNKVQVIFEAMGWSMEGIGNASDDSV